MRIDWEWKRAGWRFGRVWPRGGRIGRAPAAGRRPLRSVSSGSSRSRSSPRASSDCIHVKRRVKSRAKRYGRRRAPRCAPHRAPRASSGCRAAVVMGLPAAMATAPDSQPQARCPLHQPQARAPRCAERSTTTRRAAKRCQPSSLLGCRLLASLGQRYLPSLTVGSQRLPPSREEWVG